MKNLVLVNFNSEKWKYIKNRYLLKDQNIFFGYKSNIQKLKNEKNLKLLSLNYVSLFFHKRINIGNNFLKNYFIIYFLDLLKFSHTSILKFLTSIIT